MTPATISSWLTNAAVPKTIADGWTRSSHRKHASVLESRPDTPEAAPIETSILRGKDHAPLLAARHERLCRTDQIAFAIEQCAAGTLDPLNIMRQVIEECGAFLMHYPISLMKKKLTSSNYVIAAAKASCGTWAADCQVHMPEDHANAQPVLSLPDAGRDTLFPEGIPIAQTISRFPASAALLADIAADDEVANHGLAGAARHAAVERLKVLNTKRRFPLRYMVAEIFTIRGLRRSGKRPILLADFDQPPLENAASLKKHMGSRRHPFVPAWTLRNRTVAVEGTESAFLVDWQVAVHTISQAEPDGEPFGPNIQAG